MAIGQLTSSNLLFPTNGAWSVIIDFDPFDIDWKRVARHQHPCLTIDSLQSLALHSLKAWHSLRFQRGPVPSLQMTEGLLNMPQCEFGLD